MSEPLPRDEVVNLDALRFEELGRASLVGRESDVELFLDGPHVAPELHRQGRCTERNREFLRNDFQGFN